MPKFASDSGPAMRATKFWSLGPGLYRCATKRVLALRVPKPGCFN